MADENRNASNALSLLDALEREPQAFGFFQAMRRLEAERRDKPRLGEGQRAADEPVRLSQEPSLAFAPSTLAAFERRGDGLPPRLIVHFLGMFGPNGPLPLHLTDYARDRMRNAHDPTFARFLDVFHHRILTLFYRAWANAEPTVAFDRPESDRFAVYVGSLFGLGGPSFRDRDTMPDLAKLHFAGRFAAPTRNAEGLQAILEAFFTMPVGIEQFVGEWMQLPKETLCLLGRSPETGTIGSTATIGARVWGCHQKFRIALGPMNLADYERLLPGGDSLARLVAIVRNYVGDALSWDVNLILRAAEVPATRLGRYGRLGWTSWLAGRDEQQSADDLKLRRGSAMREVAQERSR